MNGIKYKIKTGKKIQLKITRKRNTLESNKIKVNLLKTKICRFKHVLCSLTLIRKI